MSFKKEANLYNKKKNQFLKNHAGDYVLIKGEKVLGFFHSEKEAFEEGIKQLGLTEMFIKQILKSEPKTFIPAFSTTNHARL